MQHPNRDRLRLAGQILHRSLSEADPAAWFRILDSVRSSRSPIECLCQGESSPLPMYVARHGSILILKRAPGTGPQHHPGCPSHGEITESSAGIHGQLAAVEQSSGGGVRVHLDIPLTTLTSSNARSLGDGRQPNVNGQSNQATITLLGLLELLWERSGLHKWRPDAGPRRLNHVYSKLVEEAGEIHIGKLPGQAAIFIPNTFLDEVAMARKVRDLSDQFESLRSVCTQFETPVLLVIGEVRSLFDSQHGAGMRIKGLPNGATIWMSAHLAEAVSQKFNAPVKRFIAGSELGTRLFCIAGVQLSRSGSLNATTCSFFEVSSDFIPVDSAHEACLASSLVNGGRSFTKPLRYRTTEFLHPDFILHDANGGDWMLEVWGMNTPDYQIRKSQKIQQYRDKGQRLWQWDATKSAQIPPIPTKR